MGHSQLQKLEKQREALSKRIAEEKRKVNGRRKYLIGEAFEKAVADGKIGADVIQRLTSHYIKNKADRELLGLPLGENLKKNDVDSQVSNNHHNY